VETADGGFIDDDKRPPKKIAPKMTISPTMKIDDTRQTA
jgi:hypothetical protein